MRMRHGILELKKNKQKKLTTLRDEISMRGDERTDPQLQLPPITSPMKKKKRKKKFTWTSIPSLLYKP